jgi:CubicO group peptidase (beta-lactamase class C family)
LAFKESPHSLHDDANFFIGATQRHRSFNNIKEIVMNSWKICAASAALAAITIAKPIYADDHPFASLSGKVDSFSQFLPSTKAATKAVAQPSWNATKQAQFERDIQAALIAADVPGASIAIVKGGQIVSLKGYGVKQKGRTEAVKADSQFMIGSISKPVTTTMMATIVDSGAASWDTPAKQIFPSFRVADAAQSNQVTLRNLVCNCIGTERRDFEILFNGNTLNAPRVITSIASYALQQPLGQSFLYNNQLVATGGYITALAGAGPQANLLTNYQQQLHARVLQPIGMNNTTTSFDAVAQRRNFAQPHGLTLEYQQTPIAVALNKWATAIAPAGGIWSTAEDMARYTITQLNRGVGPAGDRVVSAMNLETTWAPQVAVSSTVNYGLGWFLAPFKGKRSISHGGNVYGFTAEVNFLPDDGIGVVVLSNADNSLLPNFAIGRALELLFDLPNNATTAALTQAILPTLSTYTTLSMLSTAVPGAEVAPFIGTYSNADLGVATLSYVNGEFFLNVGEFKTELVKYVQDGVTYFVTADPPAAAQVFTLQTNATGQPTLTFISTRSYVFNKTGG